MQGSETSRALWSVKMENVILIAAVVSAAAVLLFAAAQYNGLVAARNRVKTQWAQVDVQLKRRADLIPNLVETVKGYAKHEESALTGVTAARAKMLSAANPKAALTADGELSSALQKVLALREAYPELKANANFGQLSLQLTETEGKIAYARQFYNDTVLIYMDKIQMFPGSVFAALFGFKEEDYLSATEQERQSVAVKF